MNSFRIRIHNSDKKVGDFSLYIWPFYTKTPEKIQLYSKKMLKKCANSYCGKGSDNLFWTRHYRKYMLSMQNLDCKTFYVNRVSSPCDQYCLLTALGVINKPHM